ncbi:MAG: hypothetical protein N3B21_10650 [Clostridia bacterium]|nr:hypothetical protein [Clostridia bacterium]
MSNCFGFPCSGDYYRQGNSGMQPVYPAGTLMPAYPSMQSLPMYPAAPIGTTLPTGLPAGANVTPPPPVVPVEAEVAPQTVQDVLYTPGYLKTQIGRRVKVEFLIGTDMLTDRDGTLMAVGASYIILREAETDDLLLCDLYSIKFVRFYY